MKVFDLSKLLFRVEVMREIISSNFYKLCQQWNNFPSCGVPQSLQELIPTQYAEILWRNRAKLASRHDFRELTPKIGVQCPFRGGTPGECKCNEQYLSLIHI